MLVETEKKELEYLVEVEDVVESSYDLAATIAVEQPDNEGVELVEEGEIEDLKNLKLGRRRRACTTIQKLRMEVGPRLS